MKRLFPILAAGMMASLSVVAGIGTVHAQENAEARFNSTVAPRRIAMGVGKSVIIDLPQDAAEIFVANPKVANAVVRSPRKLYVIGMDTGQTSVFAMDKQGRQIAALELSIGRDVGELQQILRTAMPDAAVAARTVNDTIILTGAVDSIEDAQRACDIAKGFAQRLDAGAPPGIAAGAPGAPGAPGAAGACAGGQVVNVLTIRGRNQVMLKVTVAEMDRAVAKQLGITTSSLTASWGTFTQFNPFAINGTLASLPVTGTNALATAAQNGTATALTAHNPANTLTATLQAFERYGVTRILAEPNVSAVSGESARLVVGGQVPIPVLSFGAGGLPIPSILYKDYGVSLKFTPIVLAAGRIELHLSTEVSDIDNTLSATLISGFPVPAFFVRKNETTVEIPSGGSIASAGLIQTRSLQIINGLPGLLNLPILGTLFRSNDYRRQETELVIIVTPYIVKPAKPDEIARPTDGFTDATDPQAWLLGRVNQLYATPSNPEALRDYKGPVGFIQD